MKRLALCLLVKATLAVPLLAGPEAGFDAKVAELARDKGSAAQTALAIHAYVRDEIRQKSTSYT